MKCGDPNNPDGPGLRANGQPCGMPCVKGMHRCVLHGGSSPAAKIKAERAMAILRLPAIEALYRILDQFEQNPCVTCGYPKGDSDEKRMIVRLCSTVLDRAGMGPHSTLDIKQDTGDFDLKLLTGPETAELDSLLTSFASLKQRVALRLHAAAYGIPAAPAEQTTDLGQVTH